MYEKLETLNMNLLFHRNSFENNSDLHNLRLWKNWVRIILECCIELTTFTNEAKAFFSDIEEKMDQ